MESLTHQQYRGEVYAIGNYVISLVQERITTAISVEEKVFWYKLIGDNYMSMTLVSPEGSKLRDNFAGMLGHFFSE